jgi:hypothetical protein
MNALADGCKRKINKDPLFIVRGVDIDEYDQFLSYDDDDERLINLDLLEPKRMLINNNNNNNNNNNDIAIEQVVSDPLLIDNQVSGDSSSDIKNMVEQDDDVHANLENNFDNESVVDYENDTEDESEHAEFELNNEKIYSNKESVESSNNVSKNLVRKPDGPTHHYPTRSRGALPGDMFTYGIYVGKIRVTNMSIKKSVKKLGKEITRKSLIKEVENFLSKEVWGKVFWEKLSKKQRRRALRSFTFLKEKYGPNGAFDKLKSRNVVIGSQQDKSEFGNLYSPTVDISSVFAVAAIAAKEGRHVVTFDVGSAYLNAKIDHEEFVILEPIIADILIELDPTYAATRAPNGILAVKLNKAQYGCVDSAKLWYCEL